MDYKNILGFLTIAIAIISYSLYFRNIYLGKTKPHAFSWFIWSVLAGIVFVAQVVEKGGAGAWITGFTAIVCFIISVIASFKTSEQFGIFDWLSLTAAVASIILWRFTKNPTLSVILISLTFAWGFLPTFRKAYYKPFEETATTFALNGLKFGISIFALSAFTISTWLYPATLAILNGVFTIFLLILRKQSSKLK
jgi:hypothetical protein